MDNFTTAETQTTGTTTTTGNDRLITLTVGEFTTEGAGFFGTGGKERLTSTGETVTFKFSDIAALDEGQDDFGTLFTIVYLREDSDYGSVFGEDELYVPGRTVEGVRTYINNQ